MHREVSVMGGVMLVVSHEFYYARMLEGRDDMLSGSCVARVHAWRGFMHSAGSCIAEL